MGKSALNAAVGYLHALQELVLIAAGNVHGITEEIRIVAAEVIVLDALCAAAKDFRLAVGIKDGQTVCLLMFCDDLCRLHAAHEQLGHLCVYFINDLSCFL